MWIKSSYSDGSNNCLELALGKGEVALRDSKAPALGPLTVPATAFTALVRTLKTR
ncbi:DUF397 domain-containing protein [Streptomyces acidiscabies]|uniref:DUF397 domain-containing protein n=1 Tax=Streptomyces acidiscabies TaxID=42234 RepID=A0AAP6BI12_9ACTN|nr:DUF397 domain-containing protein [Streptomyces acidiscabies]MBP5939069.1 DUF397 domain-containing protein [Streptomyces sp. LBUM 1476]MBZ3910182.1 DUF397 domain-containing protein [Streptomyces acidiscabies]MDX2965126.1 DUF397 domain-containing protein [Streptomyces acidiscabies]MDX3023644.1 DUF397 domain-containing protein [Streptomyces acidiscabies]MDX3789722.1 DUF397 domain-containing protein [Streptomyces acidiscabies]